MKYFLSIILILFLSLTAMSQQTEKIAHDPALNYDWRVQEATLASLQ